MIASKPRQRVEASGLWPIFYSTLGVMVVAIAGSGVAAGRVPTYDLTTPAGRKELLAVVQREGFEAGRRALTGNPTHRGARDTLVGALFMWRPHKPSLDRQAFNALFLAVRGDRLHDYQAVRMGLDTLDEIGFSKP